MKKIFSIISIGVILMFSACNDDFMDRFPETEIGIDNFFKSEEDIKMAVYSLYSFPSWGMYTNDGYSLTDNMATTASVELKNIMLSSNPTSATVGGGWSWGTLRSINLFLENIGRADVPEDVLAHYEGIGRMFRAQFYMGKVQRFSDVPWYDQVIGTGDEELLYKGRDPRDFVVQKIFEDLQFAAENVKANQPLGAVDKWMALSYLARYALYEGTFRKYHPELNLGSTANTYLQIARDAAKNIMDNGGFSVYDTGNPNSDYLALFTSSNLTNNPEVIFPIISEDQVRNSGWWDIVLGNYEVAPTRDLLQAYLMQDGSYYTSQPDYETKSFVEEFQNRDPRLSQTYAYPGWVNNRQGGVVYKQELNKNFPGYHQIKGFVNSTSSEVINNLDVPALRFAETLLIYAEARAELGELTQGDLDMTVNRLRDRVDMPHLTMNPPIDPVQEARYPNVSGSMKAEILEIRRERRIEMALEGYRFDDLMRWEAAKLVEKEPEGIYFSGLGKHDITGDGIEDIVLLDVDQSIPSGQDKEINELGETLIYYRVGPVDSDASFFISGDNQGTMVAEPERGTFINPKYYYRPIPLSDVTVNPNLEQIFGWE